MDRIAFLDKTIKFDREQFCCAIEFLICSFWRSTRFDTDLNSEAEARFVIFQITRWFFLIEIVWLKNLNKPVRSLDCVMTIEAHFRQ
jgi:hypothetical protein